MYDSYAPIPHSPQSARLASDLDAEQLPLWQIQVAGNAKHDFANRVVAGSRNALLDHPDEEVRNLKTFEKVKRVRLLSGQVNFCEEADLNQIGVQAWNPVIYAAGGDASEGLLFIQFVLEQKVAKKELQALPALAVQMLQGVNFEPPAPWTRMLQVEPLTKTFAVVPPRGQRHLAQLELQAQEIASRQPGGGKPSGRSPRRGGRRRRRGATGGRILQPRQIDLLRLWRHVHLQGPPRGLWHLGRPSPARS